MYLEQEVAADAVRFWAELSQEASIQEVCFITTAKEDSVAAASSTRAIMEREMERLGQAASRLRLLHSEEITEYRASQLDLAVEIIRGEVDPSVEQGRPLWVGVYNADSRPERQTFDELIEQSSERPDIRLFQQMADYVVPQRPGTNRVAHGNAVLQTWWTRSHYWNRNTRGGRTRSWWSATSPYSTFGHGEFVRVDFLDEIGGFPDFAYADGLLLGWIARLKGQIIGLLASRDVAEVPRNGRDLRTQQTAWMRGLLNFSSTVKWCRENGHLGLSTAQVHGLRVAHAAIPISWGLSSVSVLGGAAYASCRMLTRGPSYTGLATVCAFLAYPVLPALLSPANKADQGSSYTTRLIGTACAWPIEGTAFGPALIAVLSRRKHAPAKTPR